MKIAFISVRGIPNNYGGFEEFAENISVGLVQKGHEVTVYSPHYHPYQEDEYKGVRIKHIYSPEKWMGGSFGSFFYDYACLKDALKREQFDIIYEAGYTSIIPAFIRFKVDKLQHPVIVTNMDGLEYKRSKFNFLVRKFIFWEERMAVKYSHYLIADNMGIRDYYKEKYGKESKFMAYGATVHDDYNEFNLFKYGLEANKYLLIVARLEPENNISMAIEGYLISDLYKKMPLVIIGKTDTPYGKRLVRQYARFKNVWFLGGLFDFDIVNSIRHFSYAYLHGHSVGGSNPSLLEAMAAGCLIMAHDNPFNKAVLGKNALYYKGEEEISSILDDLEDLADEHRADYVNKNLEVIRTQYSWEKLVDEHVKYFKQILK